MADLTDQGSSLIESLDLEAQPTETLRSFAEGLSHLVPKVASPAVGAVLASLETGCRREVTHRERTSPMARDSLPSVSLHTLTDDELFRLLGVFVQFGYECVLADLPAGVMGELVARGIAGELHRRVEGPDSLPRT